MQPINEALSIMIVGMITVFVILFLIVLIGNVIIRLSNKYIPEEITKGKVGKINQQSGNIYGAIEAVIEIATKGKGKVTSIKKI